MKNVAVLSMDIEDWYHLDYFDSIECNKSYSMLDGLDNYCRILEDNNVPSSFFVLGEIANSIHSQLNYIVQGGKNEIGSHGYTHTRPMEMSITKFQSEMNKSKQTIEDIIGKKIGGYRASCFSLDRQRLDIVEQAGFEYDSSRIDFGIHPLYENIDLKGFIKMQKNIFYKSHFFEFQMATKSILSKSIPISGGGYLRIFPWMMSKWLIKQYLKGGHFFAFYIHPFELSSRNDTPLPKNTKSLQKLRFTLGKKTVSKKLTNLIKLLKSNNYEFVTFSDLRKKLLNSINNKTLFC